MFWGIILKPETKYKTTVDKAFRISHAALEFKKSDDKACVKLLYKDLEFILCYLDATKNVQVPLDLSFERDEVVTLIAEGSGTVHLTGLMEDESDSEEDEDDYDLAELEQAGRQTGQKWKLSSESPAGKKSGSAKKLKTLEQTASDEEEDDSDFEFEGDSDDEEGEMGEEDSDEDMLGEGSDDDEEGDLESFDDEDDEDEEDSPVQPAKKPQQVAKNQQKKQKPGKEQKGKPQQQQQQQGKKPQATDSASKKPQATDSASKKPQTPKQGEKKVENGQSPVNGEAQESGKKKKKRNKKKNKENKANESLNASDAKSPAPAQKGTPGGENKKSTVNKGGVVIETLKPGTGPVAKPGKNVIVYYRGRLKSTNDEFDSMTGGKGFRFRLGAGEVIKGWDVGVDGMKVGEKRRLTVPPKFAYGDKGVSDKIPPNSALVFDVELKAVS